MRKFDTWLPTVLALIGFSLACWLGNKWVMSGTALLLGAALSVTITHVTEGRHVR